MTTNLRRSQKGERHVRITMLSNALLMKLLLEGTRDHYELAEETGLNVRTVQDYCRALHRQKAAHIAEWSLDASGARTLRVYKLGVGRDAPQPRMSAAERSERYRLKKKVQQKALKGDAWTGAILNVYSTSRAYLRAGVVK